MRILIVSHGHPPWGLAGVERVSERTAFALRDTGHEVTVLSRKPTPAPPLPSVERVRRRDGVDIVMIGGGAHPPGGPFPGYEDRLERIFERLLLEVLPDVVIVGHLFSHSPGYVQVAHRWGVPVVVELHDFYTVCERAHLERTDGRLCGGPEGGRACARHCFAEQDDAAGRWALRTHLFNLAVSQADALICPSRFVADYFERELGLARERVQVIPNGIPSGSILTHPSPATCGSSAAYMPTPSAATGAHTTTAPHLAHAARGCQSAALPSTESLHLATLAVATPHKGQHVVVDALRKARLPHVRYTLFGTLTQPYAQRLRKAARQVDGLELRTYGAYDPSDLPLLLADVDAVVIPSLVWETFSIVAREAMACGVPVIASRLGALPEAIRENENGLLFAPGASSELAMLLQRLDAHRPMLARLRAGVTPSDWITVHERTQRLEGVLERVRGGARRAHERGPAQPDLSALRTLLAAGT